MGGDEGMKNKSPNLPSASVFVISVVLPFLALITSPKIENSLYMNEDSD